MRYPLSVREKFRQRTTTSTSITVHGAIQEAQPTDSLMTANDSAPADQSQAPDTDTAAAADDGDDNEDNNEDKNEDKNDDAEFTNALLDETTAAVISDHGN